MFSLTIFIGNGMWALLYKNEEKAVRDFALFNSPPINIDPSVKLEILPFTIDLIDDFGHHVRVRATSIHGAVLEDLEVSKLAHCERALHQQRTQLQAQKMSEADQTIRTARAANGPAIITPMGNGGYPRG